MIGGPPEMAHLIFRWTGQVGRPLH